jgi:arginine/lysine/ornithine decarboxylase
MKKKKKDKSSIKDSGTLTGFLRGYASSDPVSFHMPGHKGRKKIFEENGFGDLVSDLVSWDITEIPGADALQQPHGVIRDLMEEYASLYSVRKTELLVNGSSAGVMAAILASVPRGGKLVLGRNSHKSAFSAMRLGGITPVYVDPVTYEDTGLQGPVDVYDVEKAMAENEGVLAVLITSPNYYGITSDIREIADVVHSRGGILIVDQAHGAHLRFFDYVNYKDIFGRMAAEGQGADIVVNSTHKTLLSFTQSAILNICSDRVDVQELESMLGMLQSTSPSYILMASLEANLRIINDEGGKLFTEWKKDISYFYRKARDVRGLYVIDEPELDRTKINISMKKIGLGGEDLERELIARGIWPEMSHGDFVMLMTGLGNRRGDYRKLLAALEEISDEHRSEMSDEDQEPPKAIKPEHLESRAIPVSREYVPLSESRGRVLYDPIVPFPPGIPAACPGEVMTDNVIDFLREKTDSGATVIGIGDDGKIAVGPDETGGI